MVGPFKLYEYIDGYDLTLQCEKYILPDMDTSNQSYPLLLEKVENGELGAKTGKGFYEWTPEFTEAWRKKILKGLVAMARKDKKQNKSTIENSYKQVLLFALARPIALRQRDSERVFHELFDWAKYASIQRHGSESMIDKMFSMRIHEDSAPGYLAEADLAEDAIIRTLDASNLVSHVNELIAEQDG